MCETLLTGLASVSVFRHIATVLLKGISPDENNPHAWLWVFWCPDFKDVAMRRFNQTQGILNHGNA